MNGYGLEPYGLSPYGLNASKRIEWNNPGERTFEAGVDQGVLYPRLGPGVPWNGLTAVSEETSGGDLESLYFDGLKYLDVVAAEDFQATIEAFSAPVEFAACDGSKMLSQGLFVGQQPRQPFGLSYRTLKGNDLLGVEYGYKIHIVYNCTAAPAQKTNSTINDNVEAGTRSWEISTVPPPSSTFKPTAHVVLDSTMIEPYAMAQAEALLYGHDDSEPYLPTVAELISALATQITDLITEFI